MKVINLEEIKQKYQVQWQCEAYGMSTIKTGTYVPVSGETDEVMKKQIDYLLAGTFGGTFTRFGGGQFIYNSWSE